MLYFRYLDIQTQALIRLPFTHYLCNLTPQTVIRFSCIANEAKHFTRGDDGFKVKVPQFDSLQMASNTSRDRSGLFRKMVGGAFEAVVEYFPLPRTYVTVSASVCRGLSGHSSKP